MKYAITYKQEGLETPIFNMTEDEVVETWISRNCDSYTHIVMDVESRRSNI